MVTRANPRTIDDLIALPDDGKRYELHDGEIVEVGTSSREHAMVGARFVALLTFWLLNGKAGGQVTGADGTFQFDKYNTKVPDASYVSAEKARTVPKGAVFYPFAPDLAVEIRSPLSQSEDDMDQLAKLWLRRGAKLVWIADFDKRSVKVYRPGHETIEMTGDDSLEDHNVLPGLEIRVADIFAVLDEN